MMPIAGHGSIRYQPAIRSSATPPREREEEEEAGEPHQTGSRAGLNNVELVEEEEEGAAEESG